MSPNFKLQSYILENFFSFNGFLSGTRKVLRETPDFHAPHLHSLLRHIQAYGCYGMERYIKVFGLGYYNEALLELKDLCYRQLPEQKNRFDELLLIFLDAGGMVSVPSLTEQKQVA